MKKEPVIVLGFGGNAIDFFDSISSRYEIIGFVDDDPAKAELQYCGIKVYRRNFLSDNPAARVITMIGSEKTIRNRKEIIDQFQIPVHRFATVVHPAASVSGQAEIGYDVAIMPGVVITSNARIGNHIFILANTVMHHDVTIGDYTLIGSNVSMAGHVEIGNNCFIGTGSSIKSNIKIGHSCIIGMASNVVKPIEGGQIVMGNPAKIKS